MLSIKFRTDQEMQEVQDLMERNAAILGSHWRDNNFNIMAREPKRLGARPGLSTANEPLQTEETRHGSMGTRGE